IARRKSLDEGALAQFSSHKGTDAGAREPHDITVRPAHFQDHHVAENGADRARIKLAALGGGAPRTQLVPISIKRAARWMLHGSRSLAPPSCRETGRCKGDRARRVPSGGPVAASFR